MPPANQNRVKATRTSFRIVEHLREDGPVGVTHLAGELDLSKSAVHKHLQTLLELGYVEKTGREYELGRGFLALGIPLRNRMELYRIARPQVDRIADATGERVNLLAESAWRGVYIYSRGDEQRRAESEDSDLVPLHLSAPGRAILANLSDDRLAEYEAQSVSPSSAGELTPELETTLQTIRERGLAFDRSATEADRRSVAVPVSRPDGTPEGAIEITGPRSRVGGKRLEEDFSGLLLSVASEIEKTFSTD